MFSDSERLRWLAVITLTGLIAAASAARGADKEPPPPTNRELEQRIKELEDIIKNRPPAAAPAPQPGSAERAELEQIIDDRMKKQKVLAGWQDGFYVNSADGDFKLKLRGLVQLDPRFFPAEDGDTGTDSFTLRRLRPILEGTVYKYVDFKLMPDFGEGKTVLQDGYLERAISQNLAPNRDLGLQLAGDFLGGALSYQAGAFNGNVDGGSNDGDTGSDKDFAARLFTQPFIQTDWNPVKNLGFGAAGTFGKRDKESLSSLAFKTAGQATFFKFGLAQGAVVFLVSWFLRAPDPNFAASRATPVFGSFAIRTRDYAPLEILRTPAFWVMFLMFVMTAAGGLIATAQLTPIAKDFGVADSPVSLFGVTLLALPFALSMNRVLNGVSRPFFGWVSDQIGRETTMALAFSLECAAILVLFAFIDRPALFVVLTGLVFFGWGEIFSLFPSTLTDTFGPKYAATNYGFLYVAQGVGSILGGPAAAFLKQTTGSWTSVFIIVAMLDAVTALLAVTVLRRWRTRHMQAS